MRGQEVAALRKTFTLAAGAQAFGARRVWIGFSPVDGAGKLRRQVLKLAKARP